MQIFELSAQAWRAIQEGETGRQRSWEQDPVLAPQEKPWTHGEGTGAMKLLQEREWGTRGWSFPRSRPSPWSSHQVWVLGFTQERIQGKP